MKTTVEAPWHPAFNAQPSLLVRVLRATWRGDPTAERLHRRRKGLIPPEFVDRRSTPRW